MTINLSALQKQRRDSAANWTAENPTLLAGEIGIESDTGYWKVGDGSTAWTSLAYVSGLGAEIPVDRLADGTAGQIIQTDSAGTGVEWSSTANLPLGSASAPAYRFQGDANTGIYSPGADQLALSTNGTGRLFVDASGRVAVGNATPSSIFVVSEGGNENVEFGTGNASVNGGFIQYINRNTGTVRPDLNYYLATGGGAHKFYTDATERLRITSAGLVGIGTSSPGAKLEVLGGAIRINSPAGGYYFDIERSGVDGALEFKGWQLGYSDFVWKTSDVSDGSFGEKMRLTTGGRLGIGTTSPASELHVQAGLSGGQLLVATNQTNTTEKYGTFGTVHYTNAEQPALGIAVQSNSTDNNVLIGGALGEFNAATAIRFYTAGNNTTTTGSERARIDSSGRLLVGTSTGYSTSTSSSVQPALQVHGTSPNIAQVSITSWDTGTNTAASLSLCRSDSGTVGTHTVVGVADVLGNVRFAGSDGTKFIDGASITASADGTWGADDGPSKLVFSTTADGASSPTERMRIESTGTVRCTQPNTNNDSLVLQGTNASFAGSLATLATTRGAGTDCLFIYGVANSVQAFIVYNNGNILNTNNSYAGISDIKLKENIVDATSQWSDIKALQVRKYNFKEGQTHTQIGLVAQEVELVSPGLVSESPDRDEDGNDLGTVTKSVNYSVLYMKAVKALQEAMERIETLEAKVAALESA